MSKKFNRLFQNGSEIMTKIETAIQKQITSKFNFHAYPKQGKVPLLVFLHGAGHSEESIRSIWYQYPFRYYGITRPYKKFACHILIPTPSKKYDIHNPDEIIAVINYIIQRYDGIVNTKKIYLTGFSMGARGTWDTAFANPKIFAAIAPLSGVGCYLRSHLIKDLPCLAAHCVNDEVVPFKETNAMWHSFGGPEQKPCQSLKWKKSTVNNISFYMKKGGHGDVIDLYKNTKFLKQLFSYSK